MAQVDMLASVAHRCPACGAKLNKVYDTDLECWCWVCPDMDCGYIEPIL